MGLEDLPIRIQREILGIDETGKIKNKEDGSDTINCPYFYKCYASKEEFESTLNVKASVEPKTVKAAVTKFSPEKDAPVITVGKKKSKSK